MMIPRTVWIQTPTRKKCPVCSKQLDVGDVCLEFIYRSFSGKDEVRSAHMSCVDLSPQINL